MRLSHKEDLKKRKSKREKERRRWLEEHLICNVCGQQDALPGRTRCQSCIDRARAQKQISDPGGDRQRERNRQRVAYRKANHLCLDCGRPVTQFQLCDTCRFKHRFAHNIWKHNKKREKGMSTCDSSLKVIPLGR